jgi:hypothetical protein
METKIEKINGRNEVVIKQNSQSFILQKIQNVDFTKQMFDEAIKSFITEINIKKTECDFFDMINSANKHIKEDFDINLFLKYIKQRRDIYLTNYTDEDKIKIETIDEIMSILKEFNINIKFDNDNLSTKKCYCY